jgi:hypothetical protein
MVVREVSISTTIRRLPARGRLESAHTGSMAMSLDLIFVAVAAVFGPMLLIVALIVRAARPMTDEAGAAHPALHPEDGLRWPIFDDRPPARKPSSAIGARLRVPDGRTEA